VIEIIRVELDGKDGIWVTFSDGTTAGYVVEELLDIRPIRMGERSPNGHSVSLNPGNRNGPLPRSAESLEPNQKPN